MWQQFFINHSDSVVVSPILFWKQMSGIYDCLQPQIRVVMVVNQYKKEIIVLRLIYIS